MCKMKTETKIEKLNELNRQISELNKKAEDLKKSIIEDMLEKNIKKLESKNATVTLKLANYVTYKDEIIKFLKEKAPVAIEVKESVNRDALNECIKSGLIKESQIDKYKETSIRKSLTVKDK